MTGRPAIALVLVLANLACGGCYRTKYVNLAPQIPKPADAAHKPPVPPPSWQHFFVYGWAPSERRIAAGDACGGAEHLDRIETERSFAQGLVAAFAGYYINIYSPYTGAVVCDDAGD